VLLVGHVNAWLLVAVPDGTAKRLVPGWMMLVNPCRSSSRGSTAWATRPHPEDLFDSEQIDFKTLRLHPRLVVKSSVFYMVAYD